MLCFGCVGYKGFLIEQVWNGMVKNFTLGRDCRCTVKVIKENLQKIVLVDALK